MSNCQEKYFLTPHEISDADKNKAVPATTIETTYGINADVFHLFVYSISINGVFLDASRGNCRR